MPSINVNIKIIEESQPIPIEASIISAAAKSRATYREQIVREYTTCENVAYFPVAILKRENRRVKYAPNAP